MLYRDCRYIKHRHIEILLYSMLYHSLFQKRQRYTFGSTVGFRVPVKLQFTPNVAAIVIMIITAL